MSYSEGLSTNIKETAIKTRMSKPAPKATAKSAGMKASSKMKSTSDGHMTKLKGVKYGK